MDSGITTIFMADDHVMVRQALASVVEAAPEFRIVGQCADGLKVVQQVRQLKPDVVVLDITMPGLNGLDVCRELRRKVPKSAVLMLTIHDDEQFIARASEYGASGYLLKDAAAEKLLEALRAVASGQKYYPKGLNWRPGDQAEDRYDQLSTRERQVLQLVAEGKTNPEIADILGLAVKTVDAHRWHLMGKLDIHDRTALVKFAIRRGIISLE